MNNLTIGRFPPLSYACGEAVNTLCTNLSFSGENLRKIMITSCHAAEGKSFLSMNIMRTMAKFGKRVALVDADLRRSMITAKYSLQYSGEDQKRGLAHLLVGMAGEDEVIYHGNVLNEEVVAAEMEASLLINPRPTTEEFTKYSFPSKNMEYMASGTPVLTTNLPGMPQEYQEYVYLFDDETVEGMARKIREVLSFSPESLRRKGLDAQRFVLENKNNVVQAKKILTMLEQCSE